MPQNDKPTTTGATKDRPGAGPVKNQAEGSEPQQYPMYLHGKKGTSRIVNDPDEHSEALEEGFAESASDLEEDDSDTETGSGMAKAKLPKQTASSKQANRQQTGGKEPGQDDPQDRASMQARIRELEEENALLYQSMEESESSVTEEEGASGSEISEGANVSATKKAQAQVAGKKAQAQAKVGKK